MIFCRIQTFQFDFELTLGVKNMKNEVIYILLFTSIDKRIWLLIWAQACVQFSVAVFWILWAPTVVVSFLLMINITFSKLVLDCNIWSFHYYH